MTDTLYYDGKCPLCSHEIRLLAKYKNNSLCLIDIHTNVNQQSDKTNAELLSLLHLQKSQGSWLTGLDATVAAWGHTPFGIVFIPLRWPIIKPISDFLYNKWLNKRQCKV